jgi:hypothetical protein
MIVAGRSARLSWLIFFVSAALLGVSSGACVDDPLDCGDCAACTQARRSSTQVYYWVQTDPSSDTVGSGTCVQRFEPVGSSNVRTSDMPGLCGKRIFVACSLGSTQSATRNCPVTTSAASQLKISSSTLSVGFAALLALLVLAM